MTGNRLTNCTSPYLLQHKDNPVNWYPWGQEALDAAKADDKPILLSVGYAACHWCHVMAHESFEDPATAEVMNRLYVSIKVDREERPDIDQIYMKALHALGEQGGWPLTMFLTPEGEPFWGGTYFPKVSQWGRPSFIEVLEGISKTFHSDRDRIDTNRKGLMRALEVKLPATPSPLDPGLITAGAERLLSLFDREHGGIKGHPKFPQASVMELIWRLGLRNGNDDAKSVYLHTLRKISNGGIYDHLGGGIARYAVDEHWLVPHFEKMLYDNGQFLSGLSLAYQATGEDLFRRRIEETADWLINEMRQAGGAFSASLDADSEGEEGRFYVWTSEEIQDVLGKAEAHHFSQHYDVEPSGNWDNVTILNRLQADGVLAEEEEQVLSDMRARLLARRNERVRPSLDDKVLADWNGLAIIGLAQAAQSVSRESYLEAAKGAYDFVMSQMMRDGRLGHSWRDDTLLLPGFASDYTNMMAAAIALAEADPSNAERYVKDAEHLAEELVRHYATPEGAFYLTAEDAPGLITRPLTSSDEATPNPNAVAAAAFSRLYLLTGKRYYRDLADRLLTALSSHVPKNVFATAALLAGFDTRLNGRLAVIVAPDGTDPNPLLQVIDAAADPAIVRIVTPSTDIFPAGHPAHGKDAKDGQPAAYLCREGACSLPVTSEAELRNLLSS
ncbi:thioredoxin domain-containing protein [Roseibium litorale]|uniref:Thioredoxin domain-containing protein n=1 Tax=Roseibium litorale TaxID=2803841 RepID=A0ABR9CL51_9HYPH|nr:thioredoxin domain-containing protein [Roseibium litorale]MBD8891574.1 thioredoxin domain-containing protein [Roseibium litorale]